MEIQTNSEAVNMERKIKGWTGKKKIELIKTKNPKFEDLMENKVSETSSEILR